MAQGLNDSARFSKECHLAVLVRCPCWSCSSDCLLSYLFSVTTLGLVNTADWNQRSPRASPLNGVACLAAWPIRLTSPSYEPKCCVNASDEHTPINLPNSNRTFQDNDVVTRVSTTEEPYVPRHSGASSSKHTAAASTVPTVSGSSRNCLWRQSADYESVDSRNSIWETGADLDRETVVSTGEERSRSKRCALVKRQNIFTKSLNGKLKWPSEERRWLSRNCMKLKQKWRRNIGKRDILIEDKRVMKDHDRTGKLVEASSHKVQEVGYLKNRDDADKVNLATDEENIHFNISGVPNAMVKRSHSIIVHNLIQQIENHPQRQALQSDLQQHQAFNPFSKESKDAIMAAGNTELCEIVDVEPKSQCRACLTYWDVGIVYCTCGHLLEDDTTENKKYISSVLDLFSIPNFYIRKGRPHGHRYGKGPGCKEYHTAKQLQKRCRKKKYDNIHDRFIRDKFFRKTMIELGRSEEIILEMDRLASEDHTHIATQEEIDVYRGNWWIRSNVVNFDTMPTRRQPDFKKALSTLYRLKKAEDKKHPENWSQSSSSWWQWQTNWWEPSYENSPQRWSDHGSNGETCENQRINYSFAARISARIECKIYRDYINNSQRSLLSPTGGVKRIPPDTAIHEQMATQSYFTTSTTS